MTRTSGDAAVPVRVLGEAQLGRSGPPRPAGEWLLASAFRASCYLMRAAAQFCGILPGDDATRVGAVPAPELQVLFLSGLPLSEIAAAERERIWRVEAAGSEVL